MNVLTLLAAALLGLPAPAPEFHVGPGTLETIPGVVILPEEGEPGWDCATMGNRVCGPVLGAWQYGRMG